jgi:hypothetical protein
MEARHSIPTLIFHDLLRESSAFLLRFLFSKLLALLFHLSSNLITTIPMAGS